MASPQQAPHVYGHNLPTEHDKTLCIALEVGLCSWAQMALSAMQNVAGA